jgi:hypothetical protein
MRVEENEFEFVPVLGASGFVGAIGVLTALDPTAATGNMAASSIVLRKTGSRPVSGG